MKDIKDYLHLYLGCDVQVLIYPGSELETTHIGKFITVGSNHSPYECFVRIGNIISNWYKPERVKPILRKLDSMTQKEKQVVELSADRMNDQNSTIEAFADITKYLLDKHFDIFGLIGEGLALDRATLKQESNR